MSTQFMLVDWNDLEGQYSLRSSRGGIVLHETCNEVMDAAYSYDASVRVSERMPEERLAPIVRYVAAAGKKLFDQDGAVVVSIKYITSAEVGRLLPGGWFIEQQGGRYAACHGDDMTMPYRRTMERALLDIYAFLAAVSAQSASELVTCIAARLEKQESMFD